MVSITITTTSITRDVYSKKKYQFKLGTLLSFYFILHRSRIEVQNNLENCQPPFKRIRLTHQSADEKNNQDEDNTSDMSQDDF